jgi:hypothetical protein
MYYIFFYFGAAHDTAHRLFKIGTFGTICTVSPFQGDLLIYYALLGGNGNTSRKRRRQN